MGAVYDEDDELDFTFLQQSVRQQGRAATGRGTNEQTRDQMANLVSERWQGQKGQEKSRPSQGRRRGSRPGQSAQGKSRQGQGGQVPVYQASGSQRRTGQDRGIQRQMTRNRRGQTQAVVKRPQTMQEKQRQAMLLAEKRRRLRRQKQLLAVLMCILLTGTAFAVFQLWQVGTEQGVEAQTGSQTMALAQAEGTGEDLVCGTVQGIPESQYKLHPEWTEDFLTISEYSRPGEPLEEIKNIFVHYTANPNTSAAQNRNYFENLKDNHDVPGASSHFIIGINGEILQIVPLDEIAYAVQTRNEDSVSIECCFKNQNGQFTQETYDSLIELLAWLVDTYGLEPDDILRHYDCGGKKCPLYYVEHEDAWRILKEDVAERIALMQ